LSSFVATRERRVAVHDLHRGNLGEAVDQHDLEHVVAEVDIAQRPRQGFVHDRSL
jgi:hypothetical protein